MFEVLNVDRPNNFTKIFFSAKMEKSEICMENVIRVMQK
jgi:hypothetical protein